MTTATPSELEMDRQVRIQRGEQLQNRTILVQAVGALGDLCTDTTMAPTVAGRADRCRYELRALLAELPTGDGDAAQ